MVAIAAPARKVTEQEVTPAATFLRQAGMEVYYDDRLFADCHQFAGDESTRAGYIQDLLDNPDVKAIWFGTHYRPTQL